MATKSRLSPVLGRALEVVIGGALAAGISIVTLSYSAGQAAEKIATKAEVTTTANTLRTEAAENVKAMAAVYARSDVIQPQLQHLTKSVESAHAKLDQLLLRGVK